MLTLAAAALAQAPAPAPAPAPKTPQDLAREALDRAYGKPVPKEAVCFADPDLPGRFRDVLPVGLKQGSRGCVLYGVQIGETWAEPGPALAAAIDAEAWKLVDAAQQGRDLLAWVDEVLLAFDQPFAGEGSAAPQKGGFVVERPYLRRDDAPGRTIEATGRWTWDAALAPTGSTETPTARWETTLYVRPDRLEGIAEKAVQDALTAQGKVVAQCFSAAWEKDLALAGKVRLAWTVQAGKAEALAVIADDDPPQELAACYARAVRAGAYAPGVTGKVRWVFGADRHAVE